MENRSTFVTVVGWLFIVFSGLGLLEMFMFAFMPFDKLMMSMPQQKGMPAVAPALYSSVMHGMMLFGVAVTLWVLLSSIGLVMRKNWARISFIVICVLGLIFSLLYLLVGLAGVAFMGAGMANQTPEMAEFGRAMVRVMIVFCTVFAALYGFIIYKLSTAKIKQEFLPAPKQG